MLLKTIYFIMVKLIYLLINSSFHVIKVVQKIERMKLK